VNPKPLKKSQSDLEVNEIFFSIQGESLMAGLPCVFVRLTGCNLRCTWCDTKYAYSGGQLMDLETIISRVKSFGNRLVEITGGEPLMQHKTPALAMALLDAGFEVMIETNGTYPIDMVSDKCIRVMDIKCPASGCSDFTDFDNLNRLGANDQIKFVICDRNDYEYAVNIIMRYWSGSPPVPVLISPVPGKLNPATAARWILKDRINVRLQLQLHKIIWPDIEKGV
jgi:7-carboxy-7-deazaguanine synthase